MSIFAKRFLLACAWLTAGFSSKIYFGVNWFGLTSIGIAAWILLPHMFPDSYEKVNKDN